MDDTLENRRLHAASEVLARRVMAACAGAKMTSFLLGIVDAIVIEHRAEARRAGLDFPELATFPLVRQGRIEFARKDLDIDGVRTFILNLTVKYPRIRADEIANALKYGYPGRQDLKNLDLSAKAPPAAKRTTILGSDGQAMTAH